MRVERYAQLQPYNSLALTAVADVLVRAHSDDDIREAIALARETDECPFVIGGASLYREALPIATEIHLTTIDDDYQGDTFFPMELDGFEETESRPGESEAVRFSVLRRQPD